MTSPADHGDEQQSGRQQSEPVSSWQRLASTGRPRFSASNVIAMGLALALGFAIVLQVRQTSQQGLDTLREGDLVRLLDTVNSDSARLTEEIGRLELQRERLANATSPEEAQAAVQSRIDALGILAGTVPAHGPGVVITITDPDGAYTSAYLLDAVQELRDAGAEAMQINDVRVVAATWFADTVSRQIAINGVATTSPYVVTVIGDPKTLATAMSIPGGVRDTARRVGADVTLEEREDVEVRALQALSPPRYARPVAPPSPTP